MKHGDISNHRSYVFGFRCENSLLIYRNRLIDLPFNAFYGKTANAEVNPLVRSAMDYVYWDTEYTCMLVIDDENYTAEAREYLSSFPFNQVLNVRSMTQVTSMLYTGEMSYYVDECEASRSMVQNEHAISLKDFWSIIPRRFWRLT